MSLIRVDTTYKRVLQRQDEHTGWRKTGAEATIALVSGGGGDTRGNTASFAA
jgi:hypothetical protein